MGFARNPPPGKTKGGGNKEVILCRICQPNLKLDDRVSLLKHQKTEHPDFWEKRNANCTPEFVKNMEKVHDYPEIFRCPETGKLTCNLCGKAGTTAHHIVRHVEAVHRKVFKAECHICGEKFKSKAM